MNFLNPFFLLGLLAVAVPVVIHLINLRRPQKVQFSTLSFLNELKKSTIRRIRIKQYLLMAIRALAVLFLALALARPFLPPTLTGSSGSDTPKAVGILIDNSASMNRVGTKGPLIEQAKEVAASIIQGARTDDRFLVATTNGELPVLNLSGASRAVEQIGEVEAKNTGNFISTAMQLLYERLQQAPMEAAIVYLVTDGQQSQLQDLEKLDLEAGTAAKQVSFQMVELGNVNQQNLAISDISLRSQMLSRGTPVTVEVQVENVGNVSAVNQFVSMEVENRMVGQYPVALEPGESGEFLFEIVAEEVGDIAAEVILDGDEVSYDNSRFFVLRIPQSRSVLLIGDEASGLADFRSYLKPALEAAKSTNTQIEFTEAQVEDLDQSEIFSHDVIVLDGLREIPEYWFDDLQRFVQDGKGVLFFPSEQGDVNNYNAFFRLFNAGSFQNIKGEYASFQSVDEFGELVEGHPILDDLFDKEEQEQISLDLPELFFYYQYREPDNTGSYTILTSRTGDPLLTEQRFGEGRLLTSAFGADPGWTNFPVNPLFAPLYYRSVLYASSPEQGGLEEHVLGEAFEWEGRLQNRDVEIRKGEEVIKPEVEGLPDGIRLRYDAREWTPGIVAIADNNQERLVAVNQNIMESHFDTLPFTELEKMLSKYVTINEKIDAGDLSEQRLVNQLNAASFGKEIWSWFIWIALCLLIAEMLVSKLYKAENMNN